MGEAAFEHFATDPFDGVRFASKIRKSLDAVVEAALARASGTVEHRQDIRAAGERLGNALVAYADVPDPLHTTPSCAATDRGLPSGSDSDSRAQAFRAMAGVRL
jgi:hypothetical protein